jgi:hypothetical protein
MLSGAFQYNPRRNIYIPKTRLDFQVMGLFRLRIVTIEGYFYYLILLKLPLVSVVRPSSSRNILARITQLTTDVLFLEYN